MKDPNDKQTTDILKPLTREQRYRARQHAQGRRQLGLWVTVEERAAVERLLVELRGGSNEAD